MQICNTNMRCLRAVTCPQRPAFLACRTRAFRPHSIPTAVQPAHTCLSLQACSSRKQTSRHTCRALALESHLPTVVDSVLLSPNRDAICTLLAAIGAVAWVKIFDGLTKYGILEQKLSRKLVHMTAGPLLVLTWLLFSTEMTARFAAAVVPAMNALRLLLVGTGIVRDDGLVKSVSRSGGREELLKGPLYYCLVLIASTLVFWRDSPAGLIAISMMCGGDGLADIVGRRLGTVKLPWNTTKSWAGSMGMLFGGTAMAMGYLYLFCHMGYFGCEAGTFLPLVLAICGAATLVESLPINTVVDDNLSVPGVAALMAVLLLR